MNGPRMAKKQILAGAIGNTLEWYDFAVDGFLAPIIGKVFLSLRRPCRLPARGLWRLGGGICLAASLGRVLFGHIGDRIGRKPALMNSVSVMGCAALAIGLLPTHAQIGVAASVILVSLRAVQGLAVAGEYACSSVLLVEQAPPARRGFASRAGW